MIEIIENIVVIFDNCSEIKSIVQSLENEHVSNLSLVTSYCIEIVI